MSCRCLSFDDADKVIAFKFPAYFVRHENKTLWMFHQLRQVYELWDSDYGLRPLRPKMQDLRASRIEQRQSVSFAKQKTFSSTRRKSLAGSRNTTTSSSEVLYPPLAGPRERCYFKEYGDFLFYPSRITSFKRQHLAIESMKYTRIDVRLVLAGNCDEPDYETSLRKLITPQRLGRQSDDAWDGSISRQKFDLMAEALACLYLPYQEDSYGFVSMEAFYSRKCVIALEDSGGTKELFKDGINGFVVPPMANALAEKFDALYENRRLAVKLGENAYAELTSRDISWDTVIEKLIQ